MILATVHSGENDAFINLYTILFIAFFGIGCSAPLRHRRCPSPWWPTAPTTRPTAARQLHVPGIMGTLFSLVDKLVSSLSATVVSIAVNFCGPASLPTQYYPGHELGGHCAILHHIPMVAWAATLIAMKGATP